jgi:hypothetical protein
VVDVVELVPTLLKSPAFASLGTLSSRVVADTGGGLLSASLPLPELSLSTLESRCSGELAVRVQEAGDTVALLPVELEGLRGGDW